MLFKGAVSRQSSPICLVFPITCPYLLWNLMFAKKLLVNDKITALCQTNMYPEHIFKFTNNRDKHLKTVQVNSFQKP